LLIAVAVLSAVFGELSDALAIGAVIIVVAVVETSTALRAARSIAALSAMSAPGRTGPHGPDLRPRGQRAGSGGRGIGRATLAGHAPGRADHRLRHRARKLSILITVLLAVAGRQLARRGALLRRLRAGKPSVRSPPW